MLQTVLKKEVAKVKSSMLFGKFIFKTFGHVKSPKSKLKKLVEDGQLIKDILVI